VTPTLLAIDQGTTNTRAILFSAAGEPLHAEQLELRQIYPRDGWVEHDPEEIWDATLTVCRAVLGRAGTVPAAIGITNQRETTVLWDRSTGRALYNAIVWQDRRGAELCARLVREGHGATIQKRTGLVVDSYFSATKLAWLFDNVEGARVAADRGDLAFGTIDSFLLWRLTGGKVHATDATNAARTMLFNIHTQTWDETLLDLFGVPAAVLPEVRDCAADFGRTEPALVGAPIPIAGMAGDQHAAMIGQACFAPGMIKATFGTGCFVLAHTGSKHSTSRNRLLTTMAYRLNGKVTYALEGSVFNSGTAVQWLRDNLGLIKDAGETEGLAAGLRGNAGVYFVPAFTGLGAPHWQPEARGDFRPDARYRTDRNRSRRSGSGLLSDRRFAIGHDRRWGGPALGVAGGRRHVSQQLANAVLGRCSGRPRRTAQIHRDHGPGRSHARGAPGGYPPIAR